MRVRLLLSLLVCALLATIPLSANAQSPDDACFRVGGSLVPMGATHTQPPYPPASLAARNKGNTVLRVFIDKSGVPVDAKVETSSGFVPLDDAAVAWIKNVWRWSPPNTDCLQVNTLVKVIWDWSTALVQPPYPDLRLVASASDYPSAARDNKEEGVTKLQVLLSQVGTVMNRTVSQTSGHPDLDAEALDIVSRLEFQTAKVSGHPARSVVLVEIVWALDGKDPRATP